MQPHSAPRRRKSSCAAGARCFSRRGKQCGVAQPPQRDSVGPSFGSFASGQARKLIPAAGPPFPHANRFAGFARGPRRWGAPCAVGAGAHTRPRADEGIGPYARKRSGCPGGPFAAGGASASSSHRTRGEGPERGRTPCCRGGDKPRPYRGAQNGSPAALHRARRRRRDGCPHPPVRRVAPCPAGPHPQREPQGRRRLAAALDYVDYGGGRFPCDWTNG